MLRRLGSILLTTLLTEVGAALINAGRGWIDRKLQQPKPDIAAPDAGAVVGTPQGEVIKDGVGNVIGFNADLEEASKKAPEAPLQQP